MKGKLEQKAAVNLFAAAEMCSASASGVWDLQNKVCWVHQCHGWGSSLPCALTATHTTSLYRFQRHAMAPSRQQCRLCLSSGLQASPRAPAAGLVYPPVPGTGARTAPEGPCARGEVGPGAPKHPSALPTT